MKTQILSLLLLSTAFFLTTTTSQAQKIFRKGYIITKQNDTLRGDIRLPLKSVDETNFSFRQDNNSEFKAISPQNVRAISTGIQYFVPKKVSYDDKKELRFLEVLSTGAVNTYRLNKENYYIEKGDKMYHLTNIERKYVKGDGSTYTAYSKRYIGLLANAFRDEPQLKRQIRNTSFTSRALIKISKKYSELACPGCPFTDYTQNIKHSVYFEPQAGISYASLTFQTSDDHITDLSPFAGINFRFFSPRDPNWNYITGLNYSSYKFEDIIRHSVNGANENNYIKLSYSAFSIPLIVEYTFGNHKLQPSIRLGYNNVFVNYSEYSVGDLLIFDNSAFPRDMLSSQSTNFLNYQIGFLAGTGIRYRLNENSFLLLNGNFSFRIPSSNAQHLLDKQQTSSVDVSLGYSFRIK